MVMQTQEFVEKKDLPTPAPQRASYEPPAMLDFGSVAEMTHGTGDGAPDTAGLSGV